MIGIIGAMEVEVANIKKMLIDANAFVQANMTFVSGKLFGKEVVVVRSGIGKVNAAICAQILADKFNVSYIINTGIAGSLRAEINIGDIVLSKDTLQHDMDCTNFGYDLGVIPQMKESTFVGSSHLIQVAKNACKQELPELNVYEGRVVSGDQFISDKAKKEWLINTYDGYCTEMEGAAIAQAAYLNNVPFLIIRAISDKADDSASMDYPTFEAQAAQNSIKLLCEMIKEI